MRLGVLAADSSRVVRILVITKRQYMAQDLLDDRFGRFFEIPCELSRLGHDVHGLVLSYRPRPEGEWIIGADGEGRAHWTSRNLGRSILPGIFRYLRRLKRLAEDFNPDILWACSDAFHAAVASWVADRLRIPFVVDLYDNFESYPATRIPGARKLFVRACRKAAGLSCISLPLIDKVSAEYASSAPMLLLENAIRNDLFRHREKRACRRALDLPLDVPIVGTAGALHPNRGINDLFDAVQILQQRIPSLCLAIAGARSRGKSFADVSRIFDFGNLSLDQVPTLLNALDVGIICNRDSEFGRYCFPQKFHEMVACGIPIVAANVGALATILSGHPRCTYRPGDPATLANSILSQLASPILPPIETLTWGQQAIRLSDFFLGLVKVQTGGC